MHPKSIINFWQQTLKQKSVIEFVPVDRRILWPRLCRRLAPTICKGKISVDRLTSIGWQIEHFYQKMGQTRPLFVSHDKYSTNLTITRTQGGRMVFADESTELWRHPFFEALWHGNFMDIKSLPMVTWMEFQLLWLQIHLFVGIDAGTGVLLWDPDRMICGKD